MSARCHCCGGVPDTHDTTPRFCHTCRNGCRLMSPERILRGPSCPFILRRGSILHYVPELPPEPKVEVRTGIAATGTMYSDGTFEWRGRRRRNIPGG